jgi:curved DNA-binding protein CbpA
MVDLGKSSARRYRYYEILEISKNATQEEISKSFRRLAQKYHPDRNPGNSDAEAKFKRINEAYQVLSDTAERAAYDTSSAECPVCWTHEVAQISGGSWRCRHCGCQFDMLGIPLSETIERAAIPAQYRVRLAAFQSMQCSWCRRFFTQPFLCPYRLQLHSSCFFFEKLSEEERDKFLDDKNWWWRIVDSVRQTENNGVIKKCVQCGALNPNPDKLTCWRCGHNIYDRCPSCKLPTLYFDLDTTCWRCSNNYCSGKKFTFEREKARYRQAGEPTRPKQPLEETGVKCPECGHRLGFYPEFRFWKCTNCGKIYTYNELREMRVKRGDEVQQGKEKYHWEAGTGKYEPYEPDVYSEFKPSYSSSHGHRASREPQKRSHRVPKIVGVSLAFILAIVILIVVIGPFSFIPVWLLLGVYVIYSIEKWLTYYTRKYKIVGGIYRLILNLSVLSLLGLIISSAVLLFTQKFMPSPLIGSVVFLAELAAFIWLCRVVSKNSWRQPSMKLTVFSLICLFFILSFAGVQPLSDYKDSLFNSISTYFRNTNQPATTPSASNETSSSSNGINSHTGKYKNNYLGLVDTSGGYLSGDGCYDDTGNFIVLINNENAVNPSYSQLISFLQQDRIDQFPYIYTISPPRTYYGTAESHVDLKHIQSIIDGTAQPSNPHVCADFAERLHNDAEMAGVRCAYVSITLAGSAGHACDAFQTTDRGLVYIDDTGWVPNEPHPDRAVSKVNIVVGQSYTPVSLFHEAGWQDSYVSMGTVTDFQVIWDGSWSN